MTTFVIKLDLYFWNLKIIWLQCNTKMLKIYSRLLQLMTCKDAINSDASSEDKELYFLNESRSYNKWFRFNLEGTTIQDFGVTVESKYGQVWNNFLFMFLHSKKKDWKIQ